MPDNEKLSQSETTAPAPQGPTAIPFFTIFPSIMLPLFVGIMDQTIVATVLPAIAAAFGKAHLIVWIVAGYLITSAISGPVYGRLGDAYGRRLLMLYALGFAVAGSALCAAAPSIEVLIGGRLLQGIGGGGLISLSQALIGQSVPPRDRARYQGYLATIAVTASTIGPVVGGFLGEHLGWRSIFLLNLPLLVAGMALVMRLPQRKTPFERFRFDFPGLILLTLATSTFLVFVQEIRAFDSTKLLLPVLLATVAVVSAVLLFFREGRATSPLLPIPLFSNPNVWRCSAISFLHGATFVSLLSLIPLYLRGARGMSTADIGLAMLPMTVGVGIASMIIGQLVARSGRTMIFPSIGIPVVFALLILLSFIASSLSISVLSATLGLISFFLGFVMGVIQVMIQIESGPYLGTAAGSLGLTRSVGAAAGTAVAGAVMFGAMAAFGTQASPELQAVLQGTPEQLVKLDPAVVAGIRSSVETAFRFVFATIAIFAAISAVIAWSTPRRRL